MPIALANRIVKIVVFCRWQDSTTLWINKIYFSAKLMSPKGFSNLRQILLFLYYNQTLCLDEINLYIGMKFKKILNQIAKNNFQ